MSKEDKAQQILRKGTAAFIVGGLNVVGLKVEVQGRGKGARKRGKLTGIQAIVAIGNGADRHRRGEPTQKAKLRTRKTRGPDKGKHRLTSRNVRI